MLSYARFLSSHHHNLHHSFLKWFGKIIRISFDMFFSKNTHLRFLTFPHQCYIYLSNSVATVRNALLNKKLDHLLDLQMVSQLNPSGQYFIKYCSWRVASICRVISFESLNIFVCVSHFIAWVFEQSFWENSQYYLTFSDKSFIYKRECSRTFH